ncbi:hypothetical protein Ciccas_005159 [Cichlidogyrus casuarinus]|uniref:UBZ3-type domain-containing protein n=1 Tax=Cichlidogyrus casuarinus TaxID=1844966 RepID=A0ABD2Q9W9_9PLAT
MHFLDLVRLRASTEQILKKCSAIESSHIVVAPECQALFSDSSDQGKTSVSLERTDWQEKLGSLSQTGKELVACVGLADEIRRKIFETTGFRRNFGGKLGLHIIEKYQVKNLGELTRFSLKEFSEEFGPKTAQWLYDICRGKENEPVESRLIAKSIGCSKQFMGKSSLRNEAQVTHWLSVLAQELVERVVRDKECNKRVPTKLSVYVRVIRPIPPNETSTSIKFKYPSVLLTKNNEFITAISRAVSTLNISSIFSYSEQDTFLNVKIAQVSINSFRDEFTVDNETKEWNPPVVGLGLNAHKFQEFSGSGSRDIRDLFSKMQENSFKNIPSTSTFSSPEKSPRKSPQKKPQEQSTSEISPQKELNEEILVQYDENSNSLDVDLFAQHKPKPGQWTVCQECGSRVSLIGLDEHMDFHFALRLQKEWSKEANSAEQDPDVHIMGEEPKPKPPTKRPKRGRPPTKKVTTLSKQPTLDKFLVRSPTKN